MPRINDPPHKCYRDSFYNDSKKSKISGLVKKGANKRKRKFQQDR